MAASASTATTACKDHACICWRMPEVISSLTAHVIEKIDASSLTATTRKTPGNKYQQVYTQYKEMRNGPKTGEMTCKKPKYGLFK